MSDKTTTELKLPTRTLVRRLYPEAILPTKATDGAAAWDLYATDDKTVEPDCVAWFNLGFALAIPDGYAGLVLPRSGMASRLGLRPANTPGLIDADYRGEVTVCIRNDGTGTWPIERGNRIAQLLIIQVPEMKLWETALDLPETARGEGGFGSTGT